MKVKMSFLISSPDQRIANQAIISLHKHFKIINGKRMLI